MVVISVTDGSVSTQDVALVAQNPMDATVTVTVTNAGSAVGGATVTIDFGAMNPPSGPLIGQTDPVTGQVVFSNILVGVPATISMALSDGSSPLPLIFSTGFASGSASVANLINFTF